MEKIIVDSGPFIHLSQIGQLSLLKKFHVLYTPASVIAEVSQGIEVPVEEIRRWNNLTVVCATRNCAAHIERIIKTSNLHMGEMDVLYMAISISHSTVFTDDLSARVVCEKLGIEVHGTVGIIIYAFKSGWITAEQAEKNLVLLYQRSRLFVTYTIIEHAVRQIRKHR